MSLLGRHLVHPICWRRFSFPVRCLVIPSAAFFLIFALSAIDAAVDTDAIEESVISVGAVDADAIDESVIRVELPPASVFK